MDTHVSRQTGVQNGHNVFRRGTLMLSSYFPGSERDERDQRGALNCSKSYHGTARI